MERFKVYIACGMHSYWRMFQLEGWEVVDKLEDADLVQFTGGSDVTPYLYGAEEHPATMYDTKRDLREMEIYERAYKHRIPVAGICRGGQFVNVMNGGKLHQHVTNHGIHGTHPCYSISLEEDVFVTSTHHQMMIPSKEGIIEACCAPRGTKEGMARGKIVSTDDALDVEVVYYPQALCFQPHPEFIGADSTRNYYFHLLREYMGLGYE